MNAMTRLEATAGASAAALARGGLSELWQRARDGISPGCERRRAGRSALFAFSVRVAGAGVLYLSQAALARWMGSHEYGLYISVWTWVLVLGGLSALGLAGTTMRLLPEYLERHQYSLARGLVRGGRALALASGTLVAALGCAGLWLLGDHVSSPYVLPAYLALVCIPLYALGETGDGISRGRGWMGLALVPPFLLRPLIVLAAMASVRAFGLPMQATTAAGAAIVATWTAALVQILLIDRRLASETLGSERAYAFADWLRVSLPLVLVYAAELAIQNGDVLVISRYLAPADLAVYFAAAKTMSLVLFVHYAVGSAVAGRLSALQARGDRAGLEAFVGDAARWTFWPSLAGALIILALGKPLLSLFGPEFEAGYPTMLILAIGYLARSAMGPAEMLLNMLGEQRLCALLLTTTAILNLALNLALVPRFGLAGAAAATAAALVSGALLAYAAAWSRLGLKVAIWHNLRRR
jgi:O-antigen/teichoic acid export membrane protein